jgi:acetyl esterase/lipase
MISSDSYINHYAGETLMRVVKWFLPITLLILLSFSSSAQDDMMFETISISASDDLMLIGDFYVPDMASDAGNPTVILFHMLGGQRSAYEPLIPDLVGAGYAVLNADLRGHGETRGSQDWDLAVEDVQIWLDWLREQEAVDGTRIAIIGGSIGSNVALMGCANDADCVGAIALSPGLDYRGVQPESAVVEGLSERAIALVASHSDGYSAESVEQLMANSTGDVSARIYRGNTHGTNLFRTEYDSVSHLILSWLAEHLAEADDEA